jgi:hypothetical protein
MIYYSSAIGGFVIGFSPIGLFGTQWPPNEPTTALDIIPAYAYVQYQDDDRVTAFFTAQNIYAQAYLDYLNAVNLPIYTELSGSQLDFVALGLYGILRPALPAGFGSIALGPPNTAPLNFLAFNAARAGTSATFTATTDDTFKRIITWFFYKGDGKVFTPKWLKRRINRFLNGVNGTDVPNDETYDISVAPTGFKEWTITLATSVASKIFKAAVEAGAIELPLQTTWTVTLT